MTGDRVHAVFINKDNHLSNNLSFKIELGSNLRYIYIYICLIFKLYVRDFSFDLRDYIFILVLYIIVYIYLSKERKMWEKA